MGTSGSSTGVHLHFGISKENFAQWIDVGTIFPKLSKRLNSVIANTTV
jgi:murein DD-endopeptidase MepM/ murein hydrolase activator NlpD